MRYLGIIFCILAGLNATAQKEYDNWYFGNKAGIDFTSGTATAVTNGVMDVIDNPACISDSVGNLLFYCYGTTVWDKTHNIMQNGTGLLGHSSGGHTATIVRKPGSYNLYYIFTMDAFAWSNGLRYSVVDINLNGGLGAVVAGQKNILIKTPMSEQVVPVVHANGIDIWLVTHDWNSSSFQAYLITAAGVSSTPVTSAIGAYKGDPAMNNVWGEITVNATNDKIAWADYGSNSWEIFDFDNSSGQLSNVLSFNNCNMAWGVEFSPDGSKIYVDGWTTNYVYQYNLSTYTQTAINTSKVNLGNVTGPGAPYFTGYMQRAPDGKIYIAVNDDPYLAVINNPNTQGIACNLVDNGFYLGAKTSRVGLPDKVVVTRSCIVSVTLGNDTSICNGQSVLLDAANGGATYLWNTGATTSTIAATTSGVYWVDVSNGGCTSRDSVNVTVLPAPSSLNIGNDTTYCGNFSSVLTTGDASTVWSTGVTASQITVTIPGTYFATINNICGVSSDTIIITQATAPTVDLGNDTSICNGESVLFDAANAGATYLWSTGVTTSTITAATTGVYWVDVSNGGCTSRDSVNVTVLPAPSSLNIGNDTTYCGNFSSVLTTGDASTVWSTGVTASQITVTTPGTYFATINNICGVSSDTIIITQATAPTVDLGSDLAVCSSDSVQLLANTTAGNYLWSTGQSTSSIYVTSAGVYSVQVWDNPACRSTDTIIVINQSIEPFSLGNDTSICGRDFVLTVPVSNVNYIWQDNTTDSVYHVVASGTYSVTVSNNCGSVSDAINIDAHPDECALLVPTGFTPNGDGKNDIFKAISLCPVSKFSMHVYNRWGELVYQGTDISAGWDGTYKGAKQPLSVFVYYMEYFNYCEQKIKNISGNVTLLR